MTTDKLRNYDRASFEELSALWLNDDKTALVPTDSQPGEFKGNTAIYFSTIEVNDIITAVRARAVKENILRYAATDSPGTKVRRFIKKLEDDEWADEPARKWAIQGAKRALQEMEEG